MTQEEPQPITSEQAFGILSAAYAQLTVENRLLQASLALANKRIAELEKPAAPSDNVVPLKDPA